MQNTYGLIAGALSAIGHLAYIYAIIRGRTKPERASWFLWSVLGTISFFGQLAAGASQSLWLVGVHTSFDWITFALALKLGLGGLAPRDIAGLIVAGAGLYAWYITNNPAYAVIFSVGIGAIAGVLTIIKVFQRPGTEAKTFFIVAGLAGLFGALAVGRWSPVLLLYPAYLLILNASILAAVVISNHKKAPHRKHRLART